MATATAMASSNTGPGPVEGLVNQGWKDSHDAIFHADGRLAQGPIALVEVQAYVYAAWRAAEQISRRLADPERAIDVRKEGGCDAAPVRRALFRRGARLLCSGARRRQAALPRSRLQRRPCPVRRRGLPRTCARGRPHADGELMLLRVGRPHGRFDRSALQSDELSQRLRLAARQRADRRGLRAVWFSARGGANF